MFRRRIQAVLVLANVLLFAGILSAQPGADLPILQGCCRVTSWGDGVCCHPFSCNCDLGDQVCENNFECPGWF